MDPQPDERLMQQVALGKRECVGTLLRRHASELLTFIQRMIGDRHRSEELFQEVFLAVWTRRRTYHSLSAAAPFSTPNAAQLSLAPLDALPKVVDCRSVQFAGILHVTPFTTRHVMALRPHWLDELFTEDRLCRLEEAFSKAREAYVQTNKSQDDDPRHRPSPAQATRQAFLESLELAVAFAGG